MQIITARKRSLGQGNVFTSVRHSVHGGWTASRVVCIQRGLHTGGSASRGVCIQCLHPRGVCLQGWVGQTPQELWDTVNKQAVRILLECILVTHNSMICPPMQFFTFSLYVYFHFRSNFLNVDIYYRSLRTEHVKQQARFDFLSLLGRSAASLGSSSALPFSLSSRSSISSLSPPTTHAQRSGSGTGNTRKKKLMLKRCDVIFMLPFVMTTYMKPKFNMSV